MTTEFDSKQHAIIRGLYYAGRSDLYRDSKGGAKSLEEILKNPEIKVVDDNIAQFGRVRENTTMIEFTNSKNKKCRIATTRLVHGFELFDLWLIYPESGAAVRI